MVAWTEVLFPTDFFHRFPWGPFYYSSTAPFISNAEKIGNGIVFEWNYVRNSELIQRSSARPGRGILMSGVPGMLP